MPLRALGYAAPAAEAIRFLLGALMYGQHMAQPGEPEQATFPMRTFDPQESWFMDKGMGLNHNPVIENQMDLTKNFFLRDHERPDLHTAFRNYNPIWSVKGSPGEDQVFNPNERGAWAPDKDRPGVPWEPNGRKWGI